jgi:class 3 adenylate cyclase/tetratricopeptide (TPR) repeat protein
MICSNCGTQSPAGFAYCGNCGTCLAIAEAPATETRRQVAVLFADVVGFTALAEKLDPEELRSIVGNLLAELSAEVYAQGGRVDMYAGDSIMATFGAPVVHENDPALACQTALGMLEKVKTAGGGGIAPHLKIRIGINWGEVIYGRVGDSDRFTVLGDAVNVASRLQSSAEPNTAYVSDSVMARTSHFYEFTPIGQISFKNREKPVSTFRLVGISSVPEKERGIRGKTAVWVDRDRELGFLDDWFGKLGKYGSLLLITGDGGIGKSRLWEEAYRRSSVHKHRLISTRCHSYNSSVPFSSVKELLRSWLDLPVRSKSELVESTIREHLQSLGFPSRSMEVELLVLMLTSVAKGSVADMDARVRQELLTDALERIFNAESSHCALLLELDDFHWADIEGRELLLKILPRIQNCGTILISRQSLDTASLPADIAHLHIEPLPRSEALKLVKILLGGEITGLNERICEVAEGNPYYIEEIIKHLMDKGLLVMGESVKLRFTKPLDEIPLPPTLVAFITQKIDGCSPYARKVLAALAVLETADEELLGKVSGSRDLTGALNELENQYLVAKTKDVGISIANDLVMETTLRGMLIQDRKQMHAGAAPILISRHQNGEDQLALIIHHLLAAGQNEEVIPWLMESGNRVLGQGALEAALNIFRQAKTLLSADSDFHLRLRVAMRELEVLLALFRAQEATAIIKEIPQKLCSAREFAELSVLNLLASLRSDDLHSALKLVPECLQQEKHLTPASRAVLHLYIAQALARDQKLAKALQEAKLSLKWGRVHADVAVAAQANNVLGIICTHLGRWEEALRHFLEALTLRKRIGKKDEIASTLNNLAMTYTHLERMKLVRQYAQQAIEYARAGEDKLAEGSALVNLGIASLYDCAWSEAESYFRDAYKLFDTIGAESPKFIANMNLATINMSTGHLNKALSLLKKLQQALSQSGELIVLREVNQMMAQLYYLQGDYAEALALVDVYLTDEHDSNEADRLESMREMKITLELLLGIGKGFVDYDYNRATKWLDNQKKLLYTDFIPIILNQLYMGKQIELLVTAKLTEAAKAAKDKREVVQLHYLQGVVALCNDDFPFAIASISKATTRFKKADMNYFVVVACLHLGRALRKSGKPAQALQILQSADPSLRIVANKRLAQAITHEIALTGKEQPAADDGYYGQI